MRRVEPAATSARVLPVAWLVALALTAACSSDTSSTTQSTAQPGDEVGRALVEEPAPEYGGTLLIAQQAESDGWHPTKNNWPPEGHFVAGAIFEPLMRLDENGDPQPYLAESIDHNEDYTAWTMKVRPGITFHDGAPLDAYAVKKNLESTFFFNGLASLTFQGNVDSVEVVDDLTVEVTTTRPIAVVPEIITGLTGYMAAPSMLDDPEASEHPVGTGPFKFDEWAQDDHFRATRYDDYWQKDADGNDLPYLDAIEFKVILADTARFGALESGAVDMILTTNAGDIAEARESDDVISIEDNFSEATFVMLNEAVPPFDNEHARKALAYATDPEEVIEITQAGIPLPATSPFAPGSRWHVEDAGWVEYDPTRAVEEVRAFEEETGEELSFSFVGLSDTAVTEVQQLLVAQWESRGIHASIETVEPVRYAIDTVTGVYQAAWFRNYSFSDPLYMYVFLHSRHANGVGELSTNLTQTHNAELDRLVDAGLQEPDFDARKAIYDDMARELNREGVNVWLFHTPFALIADPEVHGLNPARELGFAGLEPKPWIGGLWLDQP